MQWNRLKYTYREKAHCALNVGKMQLTVVMGTQTIQMDTGLKHPPPAAPAGTHEAVESLCPPFNTLYPNKYMWHFSSWEPICSEDLRLSQLKNSGKRHSVKNCFIVILKRHKRKVWWKFLPAPFAYRPILHSGYLYNLSWMSKGLK